MWAHYAKQHTGCCIRFNFSRWHSHYDWEESFPFMFTGKVRYTDDPLGYNDVIEHNPHETNSIYMSKLKNWEYEDEWRAVMYHSSDKSNKKTKYSISVFDKRISKHGKFKNMQGNRMYPLSKKLLDGIILGYNMDKVEKEAVYCAAKKCKSKIFEAHLRKHQFGMDLRPFKI